MDKPISEIPQKFRNCPLCKTEGNVVRIMKYGIDKSEEQIKIKCPDCSHTWMYHTDD